MVIGTVLLIVTASVSAALPAGPTSTQYLNTKAGRLGYDDTGGAGPLVIAAIGTASSFCTNRRIKRLIGVCLSRISGNQAE